MAGNLEMEALRKQLAEVKSLGTMNREDIIIMKERDINFIVRMDKIICILEGNGKKGLAITVHDNTQDIKFIKNISWLAFGCAIVNMGRWIFSKLLGG